MPGGSTLRQCPHCLEKSNCANRSCIKCGRLLDLKSRQTARMQGFRTRAKDWAEKTKKSRNQAKVFDNTALMVEKLKALGYFPLLLWGRYRPQGKKYTAQLQCPFELPVVAHAVLEKMVCLFEGLLEAWDPEKEPAGQQEKTGEDGGREREIDVDGQQRQGERDEIGEIEQRRDMQVMETEGEIEAQEDRVESEIGEGEDVEGLKDPEEQLGFMERGEMEAEERQEHGLMERGEMKAKKETVAENRKEEPKQRRLPVS